MTDYLRHSLLDRLTDDDPEAAEDPPRVRKPRPEDLVAGVVRDVRDLLNTTRSWPPAGAFGERAEEIVGGAGGSGGARGDGPLMGSILAFGVPDLASRSADDPAAAAEQAAAVKLALERFEPRLDRVVVTPVPPGERGDDDRRDGYVPGVRLRISALLRMDPLREELSLLTDVHPFDGTCTVTAEE